MVASAVVLQKIDKCLFSKFRGGGIILWRSLTCYFYVFVVRTSCPMKAEHIPLLTALSNSQVSSKNLHKMTDNILNFVILLVPVSRKLRSACKI